MAHGPGVGMITATHFAASYLQAVTTVDPLHWRIRWNWGWPLWAIVLATGLVAIGLLSIYFREISTAGKAVRTLLALLRLSALALLVLIFAQPVVEWFRLTRPRLVVLLDCSASMETRDIEPTESTLLREGEGPSTRSSAWRSLLTTGDEPLIDQLHRGYELDVVAFGGHLTQLHLGDKSWTNQLNSLELLENETYGTRLGDCIDLSLRELPGPTPAAVVVFTDGIVTQGVTLGSAIDHARALRVPLYTVALGSDQPRPDIALSNLMMEDVVYPGDRLQVTAALRATGFTGRPVQVTLRDINSGNLLAETSAQLPADGETQLVRLAVCPSEPGQLSLQLEVAAHSSESNLENNAIRKVLEIRDEKIRVLLVSASPSYEYRALKSLLERDPAVELHVRMQEADSDYAEVDEAAMALFPNREEELFYYDVLVFGDVDPGLLSHSVWPLLESFVAVHGGGMACFAGPRFMPWAYRGIRAMKVLLPIEIAILNSLRQQKASQQDHPVLPTSLGWQTPSLQLGETAEDTEAIWRSLPPSTWLLEVERIKPGAQVLAEHPTRTNSSGQRLPVILRHYVGAGEVLFHATDETWRWRWRTDDRYFARYWGQVVRQLGRGRLTSGRQGLQITTDRAVYRPGEQVRLQVRFRDPSLAPPTNQEIVVQLQSSRGPLREVRLQRQLGHRGLFQTTVDQLAGGEYEVRLVRPSVGASSDTTSFQVQQPPRELARVATDLGALRAAAEKTGGRAYTLETALHLVDQLLPPTHVQRDEVLSHPIWNSHAMIALFVGCLVCEWLLRRKYGML